MDDTQADTPHVHARFLAATAHDMKNSISVLSGTLERLLTAHLAGQAVAHPCAHADEASAPAASTYPQMAHMLYQTRRLNDNLMQLLGLYKQVGTNHYPFDVQPIELGQLVEQVVALERVLLASRGIRLELDCDPGLIWHLDEDLVVSVLSHAINNAIHYTNDLVCLSIREADGWLELRVEDNGTGYPPTLLHADADIAGNESAHCRGLGLYFAGEVAKMHRHRGRAGSLRLENGGKFGGGCFILRLP